MQTIRVKHNFEAAHRLYLTPGKCQNIHGHSWWCTLSISGEVDPTGIIVNFTDLKKAFRGYLDGMFDHRVILNQEDPWATMTNGSERMPGVMAIGDDPTTENLARRIGETMMREYIPFPQMPVQRVSIELWETTVNCATWLWSKG